MAVKFKKSVAIGSLSLTPLIDIVFLLLIFFLVATRFAEEDREMDLQLPSASEAQPMIARPQEVNIYIDHDGGLNVENQPLTPEELLQRLEQAVTNNPLNQSAIVRADRRCDWEHVARVLDICHRAGVQPRPGVRVQAKD